MALANKLIVANLTSWFCQYLTRRWLLSFSQLFGESSALNFHLFILVVWHFMTRSVITYKRFEGRVYWSGLFLGSILLPLMKILWAWRHLCAAGPCEDYLNCDNFQLGSCRRLALRCVYYSYEHRFHLFKWHKMQRLDIIFAKILSEFSHNSVKLKKTSFKPKHKLVVEYLAEYSLIFIHFLLLPLRIPNLRRLEKTSWNLKCFLSNLQYNKLVCDTLGFFLFRWIEIWNYISSH